MNNRIDAQARYILLLMLQDPASRLTIPEVSKKLILRNEDVFVILNLLDSINWVECTVETDGSEAGTPQKKRMYQLTKGGAREARALLRQSNTTDFSELAVSLGLRPDVLNSPSEDSDEPRGES